MAALAAIGGTSEEQTPDPGVELGAPDDIRAQQRDDPTLQAALGQAANPNPGSGIRFVLRQDVLYQKGVDPHTGQQVDQLVMPLCL